jgi:hypothetical protein
MGYQQLIHGPKPILIVLACGLVASACMLFWKIAGWRWVAVGFFALSLWLSIGRFANEQALSAIPTVMLGPMLAESAIYVWLICALMKMKIGSPAHADKNA